MGVSEGENSKFYDEKSDNLSVFSFQILIFAAVLPNLPNRGRNRIMRVTIQEISDYFWNFNRLYFDDYLETPEFYLFHSYKTLGWFECFMTPYGGENPRIGISDSYAYTFEELRDVLVHEMIHYYLAYMGEDMRVRHGKRFKEMAAELNEEFGLNVQVKYNTTGMLRYNLPFFSRIKDFFRLPRGRMVGGPLTSCAYGRRRIGCTCNRHRKGLDGCPGRRGRCDSRRCHRRTRTSSGGIVFHNIDKEST